MLKKQTIARIKFMVNPSLIAKRETDNVRIHIYLALSSKYIDSGAQTSDRSPSLQRYNFLMAPFLTFILTPGSSFASNLAVAGVRVGIELATPSSQMLDVSSASRDLLLTNAVYCIK